MLKDIVEARGAGGHRIWVRFEDGVAGEVDVSTLVKFHGVFAALQDLEEVQKVRVDVELGTVCWPGGADLDPDVLYSVLTGQRIELRDPALVA